MQDGACAVVIENGYAHSLDVSSETDRLTLCARSCTIKAAFARDAAPRTVFRKSLETTRSHYAELTPSHSIHDRPTKNSIVGPRLNSPTSQVT
jgi:hypothetical protein